LPESPPWRDLHKILHDGSPRGRNQPRQILSQSDQGFWFWGSNFWIRHRKDTYKGLELPFSPRWL